MAECCCCAVGPAPGPSISTLVRNAIEAGNKDFFIQEVAHGGQAEIVTTLRRIGLSLLNYSALRNKPELLAYFWDAANGWRAHLATDTESSKQVFFNALKGGGFASIQLVAKWLRDININPSSLRFGEAEQSSALHLAAQFCTKAPDLIKTFELLLAYPEMSIPQRWETDSRSWLAKQQNTVWLDKHLNTPLHYAARALNLSAFRYCVEELHISPLIENKHRQTPLDVIGPRARWKAIDHYVNQWKDRYRSIRGFADAYTVTVESKKIRPASAADLPSAAAGIGLEPAGPPSVIAPPTDEWLPVERLPIHLVKKIVSYVPIEKRELHEAEEVEESCCTTCVIL